MKTNTMPAHGLLMATIASITFSTPADLENAKHVRWLATGGKIPPEDVKTVIADIDRKLGEASDSGDNTYIERICAELAAARAGAQAQFDGYKKMFDDPGKLDESDFDFTDQSAKRGGTEDLANAALKHIGAGRSKQPNGAVHADA